MTEIHIPAATRERKRFRYTNPQKPPAWVIEIVDRVLEDSPTMCRGDIFGRSHYRPIYLIRQEAQRLVQAEYQARYDRPGWSQIGRWFNRHHTAIMNACGAVSK